MLIILKIKTFDTLETILKYPKLLKADFLLKILGISSHLISSSDKIINYSLIYSLFIYPYLNLLVNFIIFQYLNFNLNPNIIFGISLEFINFIQLLNYQFLKFQYLIIII